MGKKKEKPEKETGLAKAERIAVIVASIMNIAYIVWQFIVHYTG